MSPFKEKEAYFRRLLDVANVNALSPKERATYDENLKIYRDWKATMEYAVEEAETKGKAEGERLATLRNARNMKKAGVDLSSNTPLNRSIACLLLASMIFAYTCVEMMFLCPSNLHTVYKSMPRASERVAKVWRLT